MQRNLLLTRSISDQAARWRRPWIVILAAMITGLAMGAESEPPAKGTSPESPSMPELDGQVPESGVGNKSPSGLIQSKGAFAELWNERFFVGPGALTFPGPHPASQFRLPGDFEKHRAIVLASGWLAREAPAVLADVVKQTTPRSPVVGLVSTPRDRELASRVLTERGLSPNRVRFLEVPMNTGWVRDFGPIFVRDAAGVSRGVDTAYDKPGRDHDDAAARAIADLFQVATTVTPLRWQGGNTLSNGQGLLVTTTQAINANIECGYDIDVVTRFLRHRFGVKQIVVLEHLVGERTGHVDMYACFTSPDTILVGEYSELVDPANAATLDRNAARLAEVQNDRGKLKVIRVPMPTNEDGVWRSFTNVIFANGTLLVPAYPDIAPSGGEQALAIYRRLLPDWKVLTVDVSTMARHQGGLRCVTLYVPETGEREVDSTATGLPPDPHR